MGNTRRKLLPKQYMQQFAYKQITCVEYETISPDQEREIFQVRWESFSEARLVMIIMGYITARTTGCCTNSCWCVDIPLQLIYPLTNAVINRTNASDHRSLANSHPRHPARTPWRVRFRRSTGLGPRSWTGLPMSYFHSLPNRQTQSIHPWGPTTRKMASRNRSCPIQVQT